MSIKDSESSFKKVGVKIEDLARLKQKSKTAQEFIKAYAEAKLVHSGVSKRQKRQTA